MCAFSTVQAEEVIAVNQDELGAAGDLVMAEGSLQVRAGGGGGCGRGG